MSETSDETGDEDGDYIYDDDVMEKATQIFEDVKPLEKEASIYLLKDFRTGAHYCECHVRASRIVEFGTTDVPIDPEKQAEYRANREVVINDTTFETMKADALKRRAFSNIVTEYTRDFGPEKPLKIIGGQHRFEAIRLAFIEGVNEYHGLKIYFALTMEQRIDVQLISNTNVEVSGALGDRIRETARGPKLRSWCQDVGLLKQNTDFGDRKQRGKAITVDIARTLIQNFYDGQNIKPPQFPEVETTPMLYSVGSEKDDQKWEEFLAGHPDVWADAALREAGKQFVRLGNAQRAAFAGKKGVLDASEKAMNPAVLSAWAFVAGHLQNNPTRLQRLYALADAKGRDPLNVAALADGRHKADGPTYRGLASRTDARERARFVELFEMLSESGDKITPSVIDAAIYRSVAKTSALEAKAKMAAATKNNG